MLNVIFDVDGTLVDSFDVDADCYSRAIEDALGPVKFRGDWGDYTHVTDTGILAEIYQDNAIPPKEDLSAAVRTRFGELIVAALKSQPCAPVPGAIPTMQELQGRPDVAVGVATGGWSHTARAKVDSAGFDASEWILASSDDHFERTEIMRTCLAQLPQPDAPTVYIGDGEWDQKACAQLGWAFVGIGARLKGKTASWVADYASGDLDQALQAAQRGS